MYSVHLRVCVCACNKVQSVLTYVQQCIFNRAKACHHLFTNHSCSGINTNKVNSILPCKSCTRLQKWEGPLQDFCKTPDASWALRVVGNPSLLLKRLGFPEKAKNRWILSDYFISFFRCHNYKQ